MKQGVAVNVLIVCGLFILIGVSALVFSFGATSNQPALASAIKDFTVPNVESRVVEVHTIEYIDRPVIEVKQVEVTSKTYSEQRNFENLDELMQWLTAYSESTTFFFAQPDGALDCDDYALALQQRALAEGYLVSFQIMHAAEYNLIFTGFRIPPETLHAVNLAIIGNDVYYIEPQTGEVVIAAHLD